MKRESAIRKMPRLTRDIAYTVNYLERGSKFIEGKLQDIEKLERELSACRKTIELTNAQDTPIKLLCASCQQIVHLEKLSDILYVPCVYCNHTVYFSLPSDEP